VGEGGGLDRLDQMHLDAPGLERLEQGDQTGGVERLGQAVLHRLADEHVTGDGHRPRCGILLTGGQPRPDRGQQIVGLHALEMDRPPLAATGAGEDEGPGQVPTPAGGKHGMGEDRLGQDIDRRGGC
jgi:hypothetical protein